MRRTINLVRRIALIVNEYGRILYYMHIFFYSFLILWIIVDNFFEISMNKGLDNKGRKVYHYF